jgi:hypothetical protein
VQTRDSQSEPQENVHSAPSRTEEGSARLDVKARETIEVAAVHALDLRAPRKGGDVQRLIAQPPDDDVLVEEDLTRDAPALATEREPYWRA